MADPRYPILITGAGRNVGAHLAQRLLDTGQPVIAHYRSETDTIKALADAGAALVQGRLDQPDAISSVAERARAMAPGLSGIIHNASAFGPTPADNTTAFEHFQHYWGIHMAAPLLLQRHLEDSLTRGENKPADIIAITDIYADNPAPEYDIYCATKAGLQNLALAAAKRLAPAIKVNVIQPGPINFTDWHEYAVHERILAETPMGRTGGAEAIFAAVRGILANDYQTGAIIPVDGGRRLGRD